MRNAATIIIGIILGTSLVGCSHHSKPPPPTTTRPAPTTTKPKPVPTTTLPPVQAKCDPALQKRVYSPARLKPLKPCVKIQGIVKAVKHEGDGDVHIDVAVDAASQKAAGVRPYLVTEAVCVWKPSSGPAIAVCGTYRSKVVTPTTLPKIGQHVVETGPYVLDLGHGDYEIHPINTLKIV